MEKGSIYKHFCIKALKTCYVDCSSPVIDKICKLISLFGNTLIHCVQFIINNFKDGKLGVK